MILYERLEASKEKEEENACPIRAAFFAAILMFLKSPRNDSIVSCVIQKKGG
jgi:hypothetical protein